MQEDIQDVNKLATTPPEEAAKNINRSKIFDLNPDNYVQLKDNLEPEAISFEYPPTAEAATAEYMKLSTQNASLMKPESGIFDYVARQGKYISHVFNETDDTNQQLTNIYKKGLNSKEGLDAVDRELVENLKVQQSNNEKENYGITGTVEKLPAQIASMSKSIYRTVKDNAEIIAGFTAAGSAVTAGIGLALPAPGTAAVGAIVGAGEGLGAGLAASFFKQTYEDTSASVYGTLDSMTKVKPASYYSSFDSTEYGAKKDEEKFSLFKGSGEESSSLNLSQEEKQNISSGVGLISGAIATFIGGKIVSGSPFLTKLLPQNVGLTLIEKPGLQAAFDILGSTARSGVAAGAGGGVIELSKIIGEEIAKTDGSEASFENVIYDLASKENAKRVASAAGEGLVAGAAAGFVTNIASYNSLKKGYVDRNNKITSMLGDKDVLVVRDGVVSVERKGGIAQTAFTEEPIRQPTPAETNVKESIKVLKTQDALHNMSEAISTTKMKTLSPSEVTNFNRLLFNQTGSVKFWLNPEDVSKIAKNPEDQKRLEILLKLDSTGLLANQLNSPAPVSPHTFLDIIHEFPSASDYLRLNPGGPNPEEARNLLEKQQAAHTKRQEVLSNLDIEGKPTPEQIAQVQEALGAVQEATQPFSESEYYDRPTFTPAIEGALSDTRVEKYNIAQIKARVATAESLKQNVIDDYEKEIADSVAVTSKNELKTQLIEHDAALDLINRFTGKVKSPEAKQLRKAHKEKGTFSPYAIDPKYLPEEMRAAVVDDPNLIKRKVFVTGGLAPNDAAAMLGVDNGESLIKFLANSPDKKDLLQRRQELDAELKGDLQEIYNPKIELATTKAFTDLSNTHYEEMKFLKEKEWGQTKAGIKTIALPLPFIPEINQKAKVIIASTPIKDLNAYQFVVGEKKSQRMAVDHIMKNEVEQAFKAKENAIFNSELAKETLIMKDRIKRAQKVLKKVNTPELQNILKEADRHTNTKMYTEAANEILDVFNLDISRKGTAKVGSFTKLNNKKFQLGNVYDPLTEKYNDVRESIEEYSGEAFTGIVDSLKYIYDSAKKENKLYKKYKEAEMIQTVEAIVTKIGLHLEQHPDFNLKRVSDVPDHTLSTGEVLKSGWQTLVTIIDNAELLALTMDQEKPLGPVRELFIKPIRNSQYNKADRDLALVTFMNKNANHYGKKEFDKLFTDIVYAPEFEGFPDLGNGHIFKKELLMATAYLGDPYTTAKISNFVNPKTKERMSVEKLKKVIEKHLTKKDVMLVQNMILNSFKGKLKEDSAALHLRRTGQEPRMVEGAKFEIHGIVLDGGYMPAKYRYTSDEIKIGKHIEDMEKKAAVFFGKEEGKLYGQLAAASMTDQGRFEERSGSTRPLDLNMNNFIQEHQAINHDLAFSEATMDALKLLKNPIMAKNMKAVIGDAEFKVFYNSMLEAVGNMEELNRNYYSNQQRVTADLGQFFRGNLATTLLAGSISSIIIQPASIVNASIRMGATGSVYIAKAGSVLGSNIHNYKVISGFLERLNPSLKHHSDGIDESLIRSVFQGVLPDSSIVLKNYKRTGQTLTTLKNGKNFYMNFLMSGMSVADQEIKKVVTYASYMQFVEGKVEGFPTEKLKKMSEDEVFQKAKDYIDQISKSALTASSTFDKTYFEKSILFKAVNLFFTDTRSQLNGMLALGRKVKWGSKKAYEGVKEKDYAKLKEGGSLAAGSLITGIIAMGTYQLIQDIVRGNKNPTDQILDIKNEKDFEDFVDSSATYFASAGPMTIMESTPIVKDMLFAYRYGKKSSRSDYRNVSFTGAKMASDFVTGISGLADTLEMATSNEGKELSREQVKAMLFSAGYLTGAVPANGIYKAKKLMESELVQSPTDYIKNESKRLNTAIDNYIKFFGNKPEAQDYIDDLKQVQKEVLPTHTNEVADIIPQDVKVIMSESLSKNDWMKLDPKTGAAGIYQFTEKQWNDIKNSQPDLGLTDDGRVSKDPSQQNKALDWENSNNARGFTVYDIPVNNANLLGAHKFGFDNFTKIYGAEASESLSNVLGKEANNPVFDNFKTVKSVKDYLKEATTKGRGPSSIPDGWGRSVINGEEVLTPPSGYKEKTQDEVDQERIDNLNREAERNNEEIANRSPEEAEQVRNKIDPNPAHWIGEYHVEDLKKQWGETEANMTKKEMDDLLKEDKRNKKAAEIDPPNPGSKKADDYESTSFLAATIKYARKHNLKGN